MSFVNTLTAPELADSLAAANDKTILFQQDQFGDHTLALTKAINGSGVKTNTGGNLFPEQANILDADIAAGAAKVEIPYKTGNQAMTKAALGSISIANGIQVLASAQGGLEWLLRNWCQDPNPSYEYRGGGSYPALANVVAAAAANTDGTPKAHTIVPIPNTIKYVVDPKVVLSGSPAIHSDSLYGWVRIKGTDVNGVAIETENRWTAAQLTNLEQYAGQWFRTITEVDSGGFSAGSVAVSVQDESTTITFTPHDLVLIDFFALEYDYGGLVPFTFFDLIANTISANIARDTAVVWGVGVLGGTANIRGNVAGGAAPSVIPANVGRASIETFSGTECYVEIDGIRLYSTGATLNGNRNLINADALNYSLYQTAKPRINGKRDMNIAVNLQATKQNDFNRLFFGHTTLPNVKFVMRQGAPGTEGLYDSELSVEFFEAEIREAPALASAGQSAIPQNLTLGGFNNAGGAEYQIKLSVPKYLNKLYRYS